MQKKLDTLPKDDSGRWDISSVVAALKEDVGNESNESQEVGDMIGMLAAYWKLAMKRYVDGICAIVTDIYSPIPVYNQWSKSLTRYWPASTTRKSRHYSKNCRLFFPSALIFRKIMSYCLWRLNEWQSFDLHAGTCRYFILMKDMYMNGH